MVARRRWDTIAGMSASGGEPAIPTDQVPASGMPVTDSDRAHRALLDGPATDSSGPPSLGAPVTATESRSTPEPAVPQSFRLGNRPALTGIRAILIALILTYHSNFHSAPGAWLLMQVFFVLSGFLITAMLASERQRNGRISMRAFYARRGARLLPPLLLTVALLAVYATFVHVADASQRVWGDSAAALFYYADYRQALGHAPFFGYLAQSWSLSVEEQFYVIWSVLIVLALATKKRTLAMVIAGIGVVASIADRFYLAYHTPHFTGATFNRIYYSFDSRADALFLGCLLGLLAAGGHLEGWRQPWLRVVAWAAIASTVLYAWVLFKVPLGSRADVLWWMSAGTVAAGILIVYLLNFPHSPGGRLLSIGVFVFVGDLSYTLYLVHFPVYLALQPQTVGWGYWPTELLRLAIIFSIAILSWFLVEKPIQRWRARSAAR
jgi:peptidoglycan/LPS O-acetylase OafA/YrhL